MSQHRVECIAAGALAQLRKQADIAADQCLGMKDRNAAEAGSRRNLVNGRFGPEAVIGE